jgi:hypothetical protein
MAYYRRRKKKPDSPAPADTGGIQGVKVYKPGPNDIIESFESLAALVERVKDSEHLAEANLPGYPNWYGTKNLSTAVKLAQTGWADGRNRIMALRAEMEWLVEKNATARTKAVQFETVGEYVDIGRFIDGEPECFGTYVEAQEGQSARVHRVIANISVSCNVSQETIFARGAAMYAAVDILESLGHRVELHCGIAGKVWGRASLLQSATVCLKQAHEPVDADRLAFCLCHPAMYRRLGIVYMKMNKIDPGVHMPCDAVVTDPELISFPSLRTARDTSMEERVKQVNAMSKAIGIVLPEAQVEAITH